MPIQRSKRAQSPYLTNKKGREDNGEEGLHSFDSMSKGNSNFSKTYVGQDIAHRVDHS